MMLSDTQYELLGNLPALRLAFAEQIAVSAAATARRGGPVKNTRTYTSNADDWTGESPYGWESAP